MPDQEIGPDDCLLCGEGVLHSGPHYFGTDEPEAPAFAGAEPLEEPAGESPPLPDKDQTNLGRDMAVAIAAHTGATETREDAGDVSGGGFAEDASGSLAPDVPTTEAEDVEADRLTVEAAAEVVLERFEEGGVPTIDTDHELAAYWSGYRAGGDDPGYLLTLAELGRHLGSFFRPEEEEAFGALNAADFWGRWMLGYLDAAAGRVARPEKPRTPEEMDW